MADTDPPARPGGRSARRQRPPKPSGGDKPVSGYDQKQTLVRLTGGEADPDQVREVLRSFFGEQVDAVALRWGRASHTASHLDAFA